MMRSLTLLALVSSTILAGGVPDRSALAATPADAPAGKAATRPKRAALPPAGEDVTVTRSMSVSHGTADTVTSRVMQQFAPGTSALKALARLPGVTFNSADPLGLDTWSSNLYVRGFTQAQLGVTLDGIPLGYQGYRTYNGLGINAAIIPDAISRMTVSQGGGAVDMPSTTNLGGALQFYSADPTDRTGGTVSQMFGSNSAFRTYVRLDSGALNASGTKFFVAYARNDTQKWKGAGEMFEQQANAKLVQPIGNDSKMSVFFDWSDSAQMDYQDLSLNYLNTVGQRLDYSYPDYRAAYMTALGHYTPAQLKTNDPLDTSYYDGVALERNYLGGMNFDLALNSRLRWNSVIYGQGNQRYQTYTDPYMPSPNGAPLSELVSQPAEQRFGFTTALQYTIARHVIDAGVWYENNSFRMNEFLYQEPLLGQGQPIDAMSGNFGTPFMQPWGTSFSTNTFQFHLQDTYHLLSNLTLHAGFRSMLVTTRGGVNENDVAYNGVADLPNGSLTSSAAFLPHVSINWAFRPHHELYFDFSENMRAYDYGGYQQGSPWGVTDQATFDQLRHTIRPERSFAYVLGYRYNTRRLMAGLNLYHVSFENRLQSLVGGTLVQPVSTMVNVGGVEMNGLDASLTVSPFKGLSIYNSVSYNHSVYSNNITSGGVVYALSGKYVVNYPQFMYKTNVTYAWRGFEAHFDANYMSRRYLSYMNDTSVNGFWMTNLGARYNFGKVGFVRDLTADFTIYNLINTKYIAQMGENGNPLTGDYQSLMAGAPRQYFGSLKANF
ncbi:TonB-dependent receptor [Gluconacetobacter tumulisoli]|nr:TonB-dependent receptor [Gluconacetobacter tumulisoli]